jgi:hypothetical protein
MKRVRHPYSIHVIFQHLNSVIRNGRFPFDEEAMRDGTSTDRSGCSGRTYDADETLHGNGDLQSIGVVACWTIDVLHDDIAKATVFESVIDLRDSHGGIGAGVEDLANPVLCESLTHRHRQAILDPGRGNSTRLVDNGNTADVIPGVSTQLHDVLGMGQVGGSIVGENDGLDLRHGD